MPHWKMLSWHTKAKLNSFFHGNNMRDAWKGLKMLTGQDQTKKESSLLTEEESVDLLNNFYPRFDNSDFSHEHEALRNMLAKVTYEIQSIEIEEKDIMGAFGKINSQKAPGPDKIRAFLLKKCL